MRQSEHEGRTKSLSRKAFVVIAVIASGFATQRPLVIVRAFIALRFVGQPRISAGALAASFARRGAPLIVDVREADEFARSHLDGALHAPLPEPERALSGLDRGRPIVTVCSVGWRSSIAAERLRAKGFRDVRSLDGGLFEWADGGRSLRGREGATRVVHPYGALWGWMRRAQRGPGG